MGGRNSRPSATPAGPRIVATNVPSVAQAATSALTGGHACWTLPRKDAIGIVISWGGATSLATADLPSEYRVFALGDGATLPGGPGLYMTPPGPPLLLVVAEPGEVNVLKHLAVAPGCHPAAATELICDWLKSMLPKRCKLECIEDASTCGLDLSQLQQLASEEGALDALVERIRSFLPPDVELHGAATVSKRYNARWEGARRDYRFLLPSFCVAPTLAKVRQWLAENRHMESPTGFNVEDLREIEEELGLRQVRLTDDQLQRFREAFCSFEGTHYFGNFANKKLDPMGPQGFRHLRRVACGEPFVDDFGREWLPLEISNLSSETCPAVDSAVLLHEFLRSFGGSLVSRFRGLAAATFNRRRAVELKHGRIAMYATIGYIVPEYFRWPGFLSPSLGLKFSDMPNGLAALSKLPVLGGAQIIAFAGLIETTGFFQAASTTDGRGPREGQFSMKDSTESAEPGNYGVGFPNFLGKVEDPEARKTKLAAELANGRLAMMAIIGMFFQDGLTGSAWGDWSTYTASPLRAYDPSEEVGAMPPLGFFDPLNFSKPGRPLGVFLQDLSDEEKFAWLRAAELKNGRVAMMATVGAVFQHFVRLPGFESMPAGIKAIEKAPGSYGFVILWILAGVLELGPWRQVADKEMREREINNGRFAMFAAIGIIAAEMYTGGDSFLTHQIRKMVATAALVAQGILSLEFIQAAMHRRIYVKTQRFPPVGLMFQRPFFSPKTPQRAGVEAALQSEAVSDRIAAMKARLEEAILKEADDRRSAVKWLACVAHFEPEDMESEVLKEFRELKSSMDRQIRGRRAASTQVVCIRAGEGSDLWLGRHFQSR
ncbi:Fucoxanthin-chlorophyll a-c binding protein F, chloroplastic [Symbiodinium microadriaticum]|uniref:Fucoxanthin-chlorophyll a-c binding protein F, chloroplastic n=1 Tax=Symbiodinium microadriaticum TaxID=2951 RepID=A0A1Q9EIB4_SYMMI|nr:Fucoxanthin-chlorophyll a-c binding protein F, chloroplastic [Symbiodinium microadriaticum]